MKKYRRIRPSVLPRIGVTIQCKVRQQAVPRLSLVDLKKAENLEKVIIKH